MAEKDEAPILNIANALTILRLILVPIFIWVSLTYDTPHRWASFIIFTVAASTDQLDGYLARSRGLVTNFGKLADSIADKALIISALCILSYHGVLWWWVTIVFIVRELGITIMRMFMVKKKVMAAGMGGKIKMVAQSFGIAGLLIPWQSFLPETLANILIWLSYGLIAVALFFAITSAAEYIRDAWRISHEDD